MNFLSTIQARLAGGSWPVGAGRPERDGLLADLVVEPDLSGRRRKERKDTYAHGGRPGFITDDDHRLVGHARERVPELPDGAAGAPSTDGKEGDSVPG
ncbi:hypothetical protein [Kitasatospora sp. NPDC094016]|uniref:hypothetical protein n=1 Tax=Kitasatospora sp. NPDC094016 TaxID=3154986 RepID=UPI0033248EFE